MYYAFYAPQPSGNTAKATSVAKNWEGEVELRGLSQKRYRVSDYVRGKDLGRVNGPNAKLNVGFTDTLLLEAVVE